MFSGAGIYVTLSHNRIEPERLSKSERQNRKNATSSWKTEKVWKPSGWRYQPPTMDMKRVRSSFRTWIKNHRTPVRSGIGVNFEKQDRNIVRCDFRLWANWMKVSEWSSSVKRKTVFQKFHSFLHFESGKSPEIYENTMREQWIRIWRVQGKQKNINTSDFRICTASVVKRWQKT